MDACLANPGAIGWKASVGQWVFKCGGSLISNKFVLTAAHCSRASERDTTIADVDPKIVRLAVTNILERDVYGYNNANLDATILRVIKHPNYKPPKKYNDIAIIELKNVVEFGKFVQPACLYTGPDTKLFEEKASVTGWGVVETGLGSSGGNSTSLDKLKASKELCDQLNRERDDNERQLIEILFRNLKLKSDIAELHKLYSDAFVDRDRLQNILDVFDQCRSEYEEALQCINTLKKQRHEAKNTISILETSKYNATASMIQR
ncbi:hypothetical protein evm_007716 [Chilo suppressalis]|nr:hypothetical protein evm_007716 [Chilo suppressalis]